MKTYRWTNAMGMRSTVQCDRLEVRDNRVDFIGPEGNYLSIHNDEVRILRREL